MPRHQRHLAVAGGAGSGRLGDLRLLPGIAGRNLPIVADAPLKAELEALAALLAGQDVRLPAGFGSAGVGAVELIDGGGSQQAFDRLPLGAELIIVEPLGLQRLGGQGRGR